MDMSEQIPFSVKIHTISGGIWGTVKPDVIYRCKRCTGLAKPVEGKLLTKVTLGKEKLDVVPYFC